MFRTNNWRVFATVFIALLATSFAFGGLRYDLTPISGFTPEAFNNRGEVVGAGKFSGSSVIPQGFYWSSETGAVRLPMWNNSHAYHTYAHDINDAGVVAGHQNYFTSSFVSATLYDVRSEEWLPVGYANAARFNGVSNGAKPYAAGQYQYGSHPIQHYPYLTGYRYRSLSESAYSDLRFPSADRSWGEAVNDLGEVVGVRRPSSYHLAFLHDRYGVTHTLPTLGGTSAEAYDVNNHGEVVGFALDSDANQRAVTWSDGVATSLGTLSTEPADDSKARAINEAGEVVGWSQYRLADGRRADGAFVYRNGAMHNLTEITNGLTGYITDALDINDVGQILTNRGLLTPVYVADGGFDDGTLGAWSPNTMGDSRVEVIVDPADTTNYVASLVTGSPASMTQTIDTPNQPFEIRLDAEFLTDAGVIEVTLAGDELFTIGPPTPYASTRFVFASVVDDPAYFGLADVPITITLDTPTTTSEVYVDNVIIRPLAPAAIPEGAAALLAGLAVASSAVRRR